MSAPAAHVLVTKDKVQRYLSDAVGPFEIDPNGNFTFQFGSGRIFITVEELGEDRTIVHFVMPLLFDVRPTPELFHYVATEGSYFWGHLRVVEREGLAEIHYQHSLLGDYLDPEEFHSAVGAMVNTGDRLDNELRDRFGGQRFHDDVSD